MKYKKAQQSSTALFMVFMAIMLFSVISIVTVIISYLQFAVGNDFIVLPIYNATAHTNYSDEINTAFETVTRNYQETDLSFIDYGFLFGYSIMVIVSFLIAYRASSLNYYSFLSMATYGLMIFLFIAGLFGTIINWLYHDILLNLFDNLAINTPFLEYYVTNYGWVFLLHSGVLLLVNVINFDFASRSSQRKQEMSSLDDEII